jgi:Acetyltransferase (GNAT) domain
MIRDSDADVSLNAKLSISPPEWKPAIVRLKFMLGEFCLAKLPTEALSDSRHFALRTSDLPEISQVAALLEKVPLVACPSQPVNERLPRLTWLSGIVLYVPKQYPRFCIALRGNFEHYMKKFSSRSRGNLNRRVRKIEELCNGSEYFYEYRTPEEMLEFYREARNVSKLTYQEKLLSVGLPDTQEFRDDMLYSAARGKIRGYLLIHDKQAIAYAICVINGSKVTSEEVGYDPAFKSFAPGTVLWLKILESLFRDEGLAEFDFGGGEAEYKEFFSTGSIACADLYFFRRNWRNSIVVLTHYGLERCSGAIVALLDRWHVKEIVKKAIRRWRTSSE